MARTRILVVEDLSPLAITYAAHLEKAGYEVVIAETGEDALHAMAHDGPFGAILLDLQLPDIDGLDLLRQNPALLDGQRVVVATGDASLARAIAPTSDLEVAVPVRAATFDEILGAANMVSGNPGMTGTLTVRYRKPTPLRTDLRLEARFLSRDGRKIHTWAGMYHGDVLTAEADGLFIEVMPRQMLAIAEQNASGPDDGLLEAMRRSVDAMDPVDPGTRSD